jgi:hypothetical protein
MPQVKTTSPKKFCVRPNIGIVPPGGSIEVRAHCAAPGTACSV